MHIPQQMLARGDWLTPYVNGVRSLDKPPLLYWLIAICYRLFGVSELAARIPSILGVVGTSWLVQRMVLLAGSTRAGVAAATAFAFCTGTFLFTLEMLHDVLLVFFLTLAAYCFLLAGSRSEARLWPTLGFFVSLAGAFLSKGLIGVAFPVGICMAFSLVAWTHPPFRKSHLLLGSVVFLLLSAPWHIAMEFRNPGFLRIHFFEEQILRFLSRREPMDYQSVPLWLFWVLVPVWFLPWSPALPAVRLRRITVFALCWVALVLGFFSISSRLEHYAFPLLPPLAVLAGTAFADRLSKWCLRLLAIVGATFEVLGLLLIFKGQAFLEHFDGGRHPERTYDNDFAIFRSFPPEIIERLLGAAIAVCLIVGAGCLLACLFAARGKFYGALAALTVSMIAFHLTAAYSMRASEPMVSSITFGRIIAREWRAGDKVAVWGDYETANSINFYVPAPLLVCEGSAPSLGPGLQYPDAPKRKLSAGELRTAWESGGRVFLIVDATRVPLLELQPMRELAFSAGRVLLTN